MTPDGWKVAVLVAESYVTVTGHGRGDRELDGAALHRLVERGGDTVPGGTVWPPTGFAVSTAGGVASPGWGEKIGSTQ